ncbi:MAG: LacI family DNA-binding transcriptional regulator [Oscillospiraceae bacterium]|nr:LacI family DNA-binding transcriptional regulator [Oscillospiraceae bacterium]
MVSIKDIAQSCGVSVATVSKALNGHQDIGEATRERILAAAKEMGYTANFAARALKTNRTYNLGILFADLQNSGFMHEYFAMTLNSFRFEAERCGYDITFISSDVGHQHASYLQHALYRQLEGVAIICADFLDPTVQELVYSQVPVVTLDHAFNNRMAVLSDNRDGIEALVRYVYGMGHRRIAYIHGNQTAVTESRLNGFYRACEALGIALPENFVLSCEYHDPVSCHAATQRLLALPERPSCILFSDDYAAIGGINAIREAGLRIPEDISIAGYDGIHLARTLSPVLTTWQQPAEALGRTAAAKLIDRIEHPRTALPEHVLIHGALLEGGSVRRLA